MWKALVDKNGNKIGNKILNLKNTLLNGQSFNWKVAEQSLVHHKTPIEYLGYIGKRVFLLKEDYLLTNDDKRSEEKIIFYKFLNEKEFKKLNYSEEDEDLIEKNFHGINKKLILNNIRKNHNKNITNDDTPTCTFNKEKIGKKISSAKENKGALVIYSGESSEYDYFNNALLLDYFQMELDLNKILEEVHPKLPENLQNVINNLEGVRIVKQDVFECTISFICSSNNNIERIRKMLGTLRESYGDLLYEDDYYGKIYAFPNLNKLSKNLTNEILRDLGFGYRAKYIIESIKFIGDQGINWLYKLEMLDKPWEELIKLTGVGRKVADCICLFSLRKHSIVPLDIHMINFYNETICKLNKDYRKIENLSPRVYQEVSEIYNATFGNYAGWVHSIFYLNRVDKTKPDYLNIKSSRNRQSEPIIKLEGKTSVIKNSINTLKLNEDKALDEEAEMAGEKTVNIKNKKAKSENNKKKYKATDGELISSFNKKNKK